MNQPTKTRDPWLVFEYEAGMFSALWDVFQNGQQGLAILVLPIRNAVVESLLLHIRQLADMILSRGTRRDDILLVYLVQNHVPSRLDELDRVYGKDSIEGSPCWTINKMLAHATSIRSSSYDYSDLVKQVAPVLEGIIQEIRGFKTGVDYT